MCHPFGRSYWYTFILNWEMKNMNELLLAIYDRFFKPDVPEILNQEIDDCHRQLIDALSKEERKVLLRLIDDKDHAGEL